MRQPCLSGHKQWLVSNASFHINTRHSEVTGTFKNQNYHCAEMGHPLSKLHCPISKLNDILEKNVLLFN